MNLISTPKRIKPIFFPSLLTSIEFFILWGLCKHYTEMHKNHFCEQPSDVGQDYNMPQNTQFAQCSGNYISVNFCYVIHSNRSLNACRDWSFHRTKLMQWFDHQVLSHFCSCYYHLNVQCNTPPCSYCSIMLVQWPSVLCTQTYAPTMCSWKSATQTNKKAAITCCVRAGRKCCTNCAILYWTTELHQST